MLIYSPTLHRYYIDTSHHNFENCLLPWFSPQSWLELAKQQMADPSSFFGENHGKRQFSKLEQEGSMYLYIMCIFHRKYHYRGEYAYANCLLYKSEDKKIGKTSFIPAFNKKNKKKENCTHTALSIFFLGYYICTLFFVYIKRIKKKIPLGFSLIDYCVQIFCSTFSIHIPLNVNSFFKTFSPSYFFEVPIYVLYLEAWKLSRHTDRFE